VRIELVKRVFLHGEVARPCCISSYLKAWCAHRVVTARGVPEGWPVGGQETAKSIMFLPAATVRSCRGGGS